MPPLFGPFQVRVDPWEVDCGSETSLQPLSDQTDEDVALDVEMPPDRWTHLVPGPVRNPDRLFFIDGWVRPWAQHGRLRVGTPRVIGCPASHPS